MTRTALGLSGLVILSAFAGGCRPQATHAEQRPPTVTAAMISFPPDSPTLTQLTREPVAEVELPTDEVIAPGKIEANPNRISKVSAPVAGRVVEVLVRVGDSVRRDQPLFTIDSPEADAAMSADAQAAAAVTQARAALTKAEADAERAADLFQHNAIARKEALNADNALAQSRAALLQADAGREQARKRLAVLGLKGGTFTQQVVVRSPLSGKVLDLGIVPGEYRNDTSAPVMTVADLSTVWVSSQVPETYIRFIQPHEQVEVSLIAYPGEMFAGRVSRIADLVDPQTRTVKVQAEIDNSAGRFRPEMFGSIHHIEARKTTAVIPAAAVIEDEGRSVVFVESSPGAFAARPVVLGKKTGHLLPIVSGIAAGEVVVVNGAMLLHNLMRSGT